MIRRLISVGGLWVAQGTWSLWWRVYSFTLGVPAMASAKTESRKGAQIEDEDDYDAGGC